MGRGATTRAGAAANREGRAAEAILDRLAERYGAVQLATLVREPPSGAGWTYELKYDGYRIVALKHGDEARLVSRNHQDWTGQFPSIAAAVKKLRARECVLDGEVCALDPRGRPSFQRLQNRAAADTRLVYFVFDLLEIEGTDVRPEALVARRERLTTLLTSADRERQIVLSAAVTGHAEAILASACEAGMEGIIAKAKDAPYAPGRTKLWQKIKCTKRQEFAVVGWLPLLKARPAVGSLILGLRQADGRFHFAGKVGTGFSDEDRSSLFALLSKDRTRTPSAVDVPRFGGLVQFVHPRHVAEVAFSEWTEGGHVRHPSFQGLRRDKSPEECVREDPTSTPARSLR